VDVDPYANTECRLGVTYNALPGIAAKEDFEKWARDEYPEIWARLESKGRRKTMFGELFNIARNMEA